MNDITTTLRKSDMQITADALATQRAHRYDAVVPAPKMRMHLGVLYLTGTEPILSADGVTMGDGAFVPTSIFDEGVAAKLNIPIGFLRTMRATRIDLYDTLVNGLLHGRKEKVRISGTGEVDTLLAAVPADPRSFLIRCFTGTDGQPGVARALLSDSYKLGMDNLDAFVSVLEGLTEAGLTEVDTEVDLSERGMSVKIMAPQIAVLAPTLLEGYRNPWGGTDAQQQRWLDHGGFAHGEEPVIFAGLVVSNSETGNGAFQIKPRAVILKCKNGWQIDVLQTIRAVHLGGKLEQGAIDWSKDTQEKQAALIRARTRDAVRTFLNREWLAEQVTKAEAKIKPIEDAQKVITVVTKQLAFTDEHARGVLDQFIKGGQLNTVGVMNAVTAYAQTIEDGDVANDIESKGAKAFDLAAAIV